MVVAWLRNLGVCVLVLLLAYVPVLLERMSAAPTGASSGAQVAREASSLAGEFQLTEPRAVPGAARASAVGSDGDRAFWDVVKESADPDDLRDYLAHFPDGTFAPLARHRVAELETARGAPAPVPQAPPPPVAATSVPSVTPPPPEPELAIQIAAIAPAAAPAWPLPPAPRPLAFRFELPPGSLASRPLRFDAEAHGGSLARAGKGGGRGVQPHECRGAAAIDAAGAIAPFALVCGPPGATGPTARIELRGRIERSGDAATLRLAAVDPKSRWRELRVSDRATAERASAQRAIAAKAQRPDPAPERPDASALAARPSADFTAEHAFFQIDLPASAMEASAKRLGVEVVDGRLSVFSHPAAMRKVDSQDCYGQTAIAASGVLTPFDVRCITGGDRGMQYYTAMRGRLVDDGAGFALELSWRDGFGKSGQIRAPAR